MARPSSGKTIAPSGLQVVHAIQRCIRQSFLSVVINNTGNNYEHRQQWIRNRSEFLSSVFGIDCLTYTVLTNHLHIVLWARPAVVKTWPDEEVARRWFRTEGDKTDAPH